MHRQLWGKELFGQQYLRWLLQRLLRGGEVGIIYLCFYKNMGHDVPDLTLCCNIWKHYSGRLLYTGVYTLEEEQEKRSGWLLLGQESWVVCNNAFNSQWNQYCLLFFLQPTLNMPAEESGMTNPHPGTSMCARLAGEGEKLGHVLFFSQETGISFAQANRHLFEYKSTARQTSMILQFWCVAEKTQQMSKLQTRPMMSPTSYLHPFRDTSLCT